MEGKHRAFAFVLLVIFTAARPLLGSEFGWTLHVCLSCLCCTMPALIMRSRPQLSPAVSCCFNKSLTHAKSICNQQQQLHPEPMECWSEQPLLQSSRFCNVTSTFELPVKLSQTQ